ncbi:efflux RND transporter permease subunit [Candidatus Neomarinimicrobiota bacterium]
MRSFIRFFAEHHLLVNLLTVAIILVGMRSLMNIKRDFFPNIDLDQMVVTTRYPGASPEDVELNVTNKLEDELKGVDGLNEMTSFSMENISVINLSLDPDSKDKEKIKRDLRDAVGRVSGFPPEVTDLPSIIEIKTENIEVIRVGITGNIPYVLLRRLAKYFEKGLKEIEGVSRIEKIGFLAREIKVDVSQDAMELYQIPMRDIVTAIQLRNIRATGGSFESYTSDKSIVTLAEFRDIREIGDVIVRSTFEGPRIQIKDLAVVENDFENEKTRFRMNGESVIAFVVFKKGTADLIRVVDAVKEYVDEQKDLMPPDVEVMYSSDQSRFVRNRLGVLSINGLIGLGLVTTVLFIFLNFRTAFWVAMGIPLSIMGVLVFAPYLDLHIDILTLTAMILIIGLIVDDAIVIAENIFHRREAGEIPLEAAVNGTSRVLRPVFATILTTILAFSPFFFMTGIIGKFVFSIPLVIVLALLVSFAEAILLLPAHITAGRRRNPVSAAESSGDEKLRMPDPKQLHTPWFNTVRDKFQRFIVYVLRLRYVVVAGFILLLIGAFMYAARYTQFILFPGNTADEFYIALELPPGSSLDATTDRINEIEKLILELPDEELESFWMLVGSQGGAGGLVPGESENWAIGAITLTPFSERRRSAEEIIADIRRETDLMEGIDYIRYIVAAGGPPVGRPISLRIVGDDDYLRKSLADSLVTFLSSLEDVTDIDRGDKLGKEQVEIRIDHDQLSQLGLTVADIAQNVRLAYDGQLVSMMRYGDEDVYIRVILEESVRTREHYLADLTIPNRQGRLIPLGEVAEFVIGPGPSSFFHHEGERAIAVTADLVDGSTMTPLEATNAAIDRFDVPTYWPGIRFVMGGEAQETAESMRSLAIAMLTAGIGIYLVLVLLFNSLTQPILIMLAIPFGLIGIIGAFALHDEPLGFMAMTGVIGMMGVVVNDSLILINFINTHRTDSPDKKFLRVVAEGTSSRLRPILLTSITTVAGLLPTAYGFGGYDPFIAPMALALGYGILFATPLTLLLLPSMYMIQHDIGKLIRRISRFRNFYFIPAAKSGDRENESS